MSADESLQQAPLLATCSNVSLARALDARMVALPLRAASQRSPSRRAHRARA